MTPALIWNGRQDLSVVKIFGYQALFTNVSKGSKLDPRAQTGVRIGYYGVGYRIWLPEEKRISQSRDVVCIFACIFDIEWQNAINSELESHNKLGTLETATLPPNARPNVIKWIFKTKEDSTKKAQLVAKGFQQPMAFNEVTPVFRMSTLRILLSQAVMNNWKVIQIDVSTAFLNRVLE